MAWSGTSIRLGSGLVPGANGTLLASATRTDRQPVNNLNVRVESDPVRSPLTQSLHSVRGAWRFYRQPNFTRKLREIMVAIIFYTSCVKMFSS